VYDTSFWLESFNQNVVSQHFEYFPLVSQSMWNWLNWRWCKWLVEWRMRDASLHWLLWSQNFGIGLLPTYHLLCACLHNNFILCKISHMQTILNNSKELDIVMMARQYAFCIFWVSFCKGLYVLLQNWMIVLWAIELFFHGVGIFSALLPMQCHGLIFLLVVFGCQLVSL
jgi:hypothetical protein